MHLDLAIDAHGVRQADARIAQLVLLPQGEIVR
jgi:hypothetical protein